MKHILSAPILRGRLGKWAYALIEFDLRHESAKAVKGQVIADFITAHRKVDYVAPAPWKLFFDGSTCAEGSGIDIILVAPGGQSFEFSFRIGYGDKCSNNQAEYEALLRGLRVLQDVGIDSVEAFGDSMLVVQQIPGEFNCIDETLQKYRDLCLEMIDLFSSFSIQHIPREDNSRANALAQHASGYRTRFLHGPSEVVEKTYPRAEILLDDINDWRAPIIGYLQNPSQPTERKVRRQALKYVVLDETLYRRTIEGLLLRCLGPEEANVATGEVHDGLCGMH